MIRLAHHIFKPRLNAIDFMAIVLTFVLLADRHWIVAPLVWFGGAAVSAVGEVLTESTSC